jgi:hypothetical protein
MYVHAHAWMCVCVCMRARAHPFQRSKHLSKLYKAWYASGAASPVLFYCNLAENYKHDN